MNYIKELNAFHNQQETNPLSASAANLWHVLMHVNNRAGWLKEFTVAVSLLCAKSALTESTFKRARAELQDKGYIHFHSRGGNKAACYELISLLSDGQTSGSGCHMDDNTSDTETDDGSVDDSSTHKVSDSLSGNPDCSVDALFKRTKTKKKQNNTVATTTDAIAFYQDNFGLISPYVADELINWVTDLGEPLILNAMKRTLERGKANWGYVKGILQAWVKKGITTVDQASAEETAFRWEQQAKKRGGGIFREESREIVPDWFKEQKREEKRKKEKEIPVQPKFDLKAEREELAKMVAELSKKKVSRVG
ncbi:DnaD/phage-associated family protein [Virgibacillus natechei]|uniref:DnaD/phage-associated family protein n=1 Tax=Virgibacillus natechei TaxID=1216297 RepID=A0ABS4ILC8_9BACI|nr:DnaD domain protein [Virgibacillus natechei]MBP1971758.1 DnaD/phage-associated family protein [Virgibacillus natechei]UZD12898.1 DnaD domain protein [Virgibacillus natechei]